MFGELYKEVLERSRDLGIPHIPLEDAYVLQSTAFVALSHLDGLALDLGAGIGFSTIWIAEAARKFNKKVIAVERDETLFKELKEVAKKARFEALKEDAIEFLKSLSPSSVAFAFVDIDKELYPEAVKLLDEKLVPEGVAVFHNAFIPTPPREFLDELSKRMTYTVVPTTLGLVVATKPRT